VSDSPAGCPRRQEQELATADVTEVAPSVLRTQLPIEFTGLGHVNCYVLEDERGVALVDPGLPGPSTIAAIGDRLATAGVPLARVHTVVVTHSHPDHFGAARWLREQTGADIVTHAAFRSWYDRREPPDGDIDDVPEFDPKQTRWAAPPWGGPAHEMPESARLMRESAQTRAEFMRLPEPSVRLEDAQTIRLAGRDWVALHTPGHTDDHLCLYDPTEGVLLSGDHVLPTITPHIGGFVRSTDPLAGFLSSLDKVAAYDADVRIVLPAHGHPFTGLAQRTADIRRHHLERLEKLRAAAQAIGRPATVAELSPHLFSPRALGPMADSETYAHLEHLRLAGEVVRTESEAGFRYVMAG
jgi:glyoxylase-like metal-dependent hydrolase (beta-lactamase superfamily II)